MSSRPSKKRRTDASSSKTSIGAPKAAQDSASALRGTDEPNTFASSTRRLPAQNRVPTLVALCHRAFAMNFVKLRDNEALWNARIDKQLRKLPDEMIPKLFAVLRKERGGYLKHAFIITYFYRGSNLVLTSSSLPGVKADTLLRITALNKSIQELEISGFENIKDNVFATALANAKQLRKIVLRGCTNVSALTMQSLAEHCPDLRTVNVNYTSAPPAGVASLLAACPNMEVLKVAGIQSWTDATFQKFVAVFQDQPNFCLPNLHTLRLAHLALSDAALASLPPLATLCPELRRLDLSFTLVKNIPFLLPSPSSSPQPQTQANAPSLKLEKLNLTSTSITPAALEELLKLCHELKILSIGALGSGSRGKGASASANGVGLTMDDAVLDSITTVLSGESDDVDESTKTGDVARPGRLPIEDLSLVGNLKLGLTPRHDENGMTSLARFITRIGRSCRRLNLSNLGHLQSSDLVGLMPPFSEQATEEGDDDDDSTTSNLEILLLNNTPIDSSAAVYISTCRKLETLGLAGTRIDEDGSFTILDACPNLVNLDLTSCRSVKVVDRRRFFEVWEDRRGTGDDG